MTSLHNKFEEAVGSAFMFPNLRLILCASVAIVVLVAIVGSSLVMFRPPPARMVDESLRPSASVADDIRPVQSFDTSQRRNEELQRLLALPSSPVRAYAPEPPATFPYEVTAGRAAEEVPTVIPTDPILHFNTSSVSEPVIPASSAPSPPVVEPEIHETTATVVAVAPEPVHDPIPAPMVEPPAVVAATMEPAAPVAASLEPMVPVVATAGRSREDVANGAAPADDAELFPASSIPAIEEAPIPRPKPQIALAGPQTAPVTADPAAKVVSGGSQRVKAKARIRRPSGISQRIQRPPPAPTAIETQQSQFPFFDNGAGGGRQNQWDQRSTVPEQNAGERAQRRAYGIRPPTATSR